MTLAVDGSHLMAALIVCEGLMQKLRFEVGAVTRGVMAVANPAIVWKNYLAESLVEVVDVAGFAATVTNQLAVPGRTILDLKLLNVVSASEAFLL